MNLYFLKANTESELKEALDAEEFGVVNQNGDSTYFGQSGEFTIDWIGSIYNQTGVNGGGDPVFVKVEGSHCNIYSSAALPSSLDSFIVSPTPSSPRRKLAGY
jgi:hypothetical protein